MKNHIKYIEEKENRTIKLFEEQMIQGRIFGDTDFEDIEKSTGTISDFNSKKPMTIESNSKIAKNTKNAKDQSTHKNNIQTQDPVEDSDDEVWE